MRDNVDRPQGLRADEAGRGWGDVVCMMQTGYAHVRRLAFTGQRVQGKEKEEETDSRVRGMEVGGRGGRRESKQNLHGNSVPVGRVGLWVFNAVLPAPPPLFPSTYVLCTPIFNGCSPLHPRPASGSILLSFRVLSVRPPAG